jgi:hypothetical protein
MKMNTKKTMTMTQTLASTNLPKQVPTEVNNLNKSILSMF